MQLDGLLEQQWFGFIVFGNMDEIRFGHDYIPNWPSLPGTLTELIRFHDKVKAVKIIYYNGGKRWYNIESFEKNFKHYQNCEKCRKEKEK